MSQETEILQQPRLPPDRAVERNSRVWMSLDTAVRSRMVLLCHHQMLVPQQELPDRGHPYQRIPKSYPSMNHFYNHYQRQQAG